LTQPNNAVSGKQAIWAPWSAASAQARSIRAKLSDRSDARQTVWHIATRTVDGGLGAAPVDAWDESLVFDILALS